MSHLTAGDILPLATKTESTYGTPTGTYAYYADVKGDGGSFTPTDNPNPYIAWKSGSRAYDTQDYVATNHEAGYSDVLEVADQGTALEDILKNALGGTATAGTPRLPSRTTRFITRHMTASSWPNVFEYYGCKTDRLEIKADQPGGIVEFDETVLASWCAPSVGSDAVVNPTASAPAVQWVGGVELNGNPIYPQNFRLTISNNLGRVKGPVSANSGKAGTVALTEGRLEMDFEMDVWMEDLRYIDQGGPSFTNGALPQTIELTLGISSPVTIQMDVNPMANGQHHSIIQDKQMETTRWRVVGITLA